MIRLFIGYDERESVVYHALTQSILDRCKEPVSITPLHLPMLEGFDGQQDGSNAFIYSRFLVPHLMDYRGWAIYADSDMLFRDDPARLWALRDPAKAVMVAQHAYETRHPVKQRGSGLESKNENYPRKNWSSLMLINCGHPMNKLLTPEFVSNAGGKYLHRFQWLKDEHIGALPLEYNWLVNEYAYNSEAMVVHFTVGAPCLPAYRDCDYSDEFNRSVGRMIYMAPGKREREHVGRV